MALGPDWASPGLVSPPTRNAGTREDCAQAEEFLFFHRIEILLSFDLTRMFSVLGFVILFKDKVFQENLSNNKAKRAYLFFFFKLLDRSRVWLRLECFYCRCELGDRQRESPEKGEKVVDRR